MVIAGPDDLACSDVGRMTPGADTLVLVDLRVLLASCSAMWLTTRLPRRHAQAGMARMAAMHPAPKSAALPADEKPAKSLAPRPPALFHDLAKNAPSTKGAPPAP